MQLTQEDVMMTNYDENSVFDWELFSELTESPIIPFLIHMVPLCKQGRDSNFHLQINRKALLALEEGCRKIKYHFQHVSLFKAA